MGGYATQSYYTSRINTCGLRTVPEGLDMMLKFVMTGTHNIRTYVRVANGVPANTGPIASAPSAPQGSAAGSDVEIEGIVTDTEGDQVYYQFDFGDQTPVTDWLGPYESAEACTVTHAYAANGQYDVLVRGKDAWEFEGDWSPFFTLNIGCCSERGDIDGDGDAADIEDLIFLVTFMFQEGPVPPCAPGNDYYPDADCDGNGVGPDIADLVYLVDFMFQEGPAPANCF